jgi:hypothetical protein
LFIHPWQMSLRLRRVVGSSRFASSRRRPIFWIFGRAAGICFDM